MIRTLATYALLAAALALQVRGLLPYLSYVGLDFDAIHMYLPFARRLMGEGPAFFLAEESIHAPAFSYIYPALFGADLAAVKSANIALSCILLLLVFRTATLWHSRLAGVLAALVFALSPLLGPFMPTALTEPPFLFLLGVWIWAFSEWRVRDRPVYLPIAGVALGLALLTRAALFHGVVILCAIFAWQAWRATPRARAALAAHLLALSLPAAFIVKNLIVFGYPFYATGAGNALYLGTSPLYGGYDPGYLGLLFDVGAITQTPSHLSLQAEAMLGGAGRLLLTSLDSGFLAAMYAKKLAAFLFITNAETIGDVFWLRSWRIATMILAPIGILAISDRAIRWIIAGLLVYQVAVHIPILYTYRYSVGALDLWLTILAGVAIARLWERRRAIEAAGVAGATLAATMVGGYFLWNGGLPEPNVFAAAHELVWERRDETVRFGQRQGVIEIDVRDAPGFSSWFNHVLVIDSTLERSAADEACGVLRLTYKRDDQKDFSEAQPLIRKLAADGLRHVNQIGASVPLGMSMQGRLRLELACTPGSVWEIHRIAVYSARGALELREKLLRRKRMSS